MQLNQLISEVVVKDSASAVLDRVDAALTRVAASEEKLQGRAAGSTRALEREARSFESLKAAADPAYAAMQRLADQQLKLQRATQLGIASQEESIAVFNRLKAQTDATVARMNSNTGAAATGFKSMGSAVQQAGYQIGDFAVQVASGQGVLRPFIQQGTQLVSMFGPWGAAIGAAAAVAGALAVAFIDLGESTEEARKRQEEYNSALRDFADLAANDEIRAQQSRTRKIEAIKLTIAETQAVRDKATAEAQARFDADKGMRSNMQAQAAARGYTLSPENPALRRDVDVSMGLARETQEAFNKALVTQSIDDIVRALDKQDEAERKILAVQGEHNKLRTDEARTVIEINRRLSESAAIRAMLNRTAPNQRDAGRAALEARFAADAMPWLEPSERALMIRERIAEVTEAQTRAANDNISALSAEAEGLRRIAEAYAKSETAGRGVEALVRAEADQRRNAKVSIEDQANAYRELASRQAALDSAKQVIDIKAQSEAQTRLAATSGQGAEAQAEAARVNQVEAVFRRQLADAIGEQREAVLANMAVYDAETKKILDSQQAIAKQTALRQAGRDASLAAAQAQAAAISDPEQRRAAEIQIERQREINRLTDQYGDLSSEAAKKQLELWDAAANSREVARFYGEIRSKSEEMSKSVTSFLVDGFVNAEQGGKSAFDNIFAGAKAGAKRFFAEMIAEAARVKFVQPLTSSVISQMPSLFGISGPVGGGSAAAPGGTPYWATPGIAGGSGLDAWMQSTFGFGGGNNFAGQAAGAYGPFPATAANSISFSSVLGGAGLGFGAGTMLNSLVGGKSTGGLIGAGIGGVGGAILGSMIPVIGTYLGGAIGGGLGGLIGGLFGAGKSVGPNAGATGEYNSSGALVYTAANADNGGSTGGVVDMLKKTGEALSLLLGATGAQLQAGVGVNYGSIGGGITANTYGPGNRVLGGLSGVGVGSDPETAVVRVVAAMLGEASTGLSANIKTALGNTKATTLEQLGGDIEFAQAFSDAIAAMRTGVMDFASSAAAAARNEVAQATASIREFKARTAELGLDTLAAADATQKAVQTYLGLTDAATEATTRGEQALAAIDARADAARALLSEVGLDPNLSAQVRSAALADLIAATNDNTQALIQGINDPFAAALDQLEKERLDAVDFAATIGADVNAVEELYGLRRVKLVEQQNADMLASTKQLGTDLRAYLDGLQLGDLSTLDPSQKLAEAQRQFDETLTGARNGDTGAQGRVVSSLDTLLNIGRENYGGTAQYALLQQLATSSVTNLAQQLGLPGFADGTMSAPGGLALYGERGPEIGFVPRGTAILPADISRQIMAGNDNSAVVAGLGNVVEALRQTVLVLQGELRGVRAELVEIKRGQTQILARNPSADQRVKLGASR